MRHLFGLMVLLLVNAARCESRPTEAQPTAPRPAQIAAADEFTERYSNSRMEGWRIRANAVGRDCTVLLVRTAIILEESMVHAMHLGSGSYDVLPGGVDRFYRHEAFRGVVYTDPSQRIWTYGNVTLDDERLLGKACR